MDQPSGRTPEEELGSQHIWTWVTADGGLGHEQQVQGLRPAPEGLIDLFQVGLQRPPLSLERFRFLLEQR